MDKMCVNVCVHKFEPHEKLNLNPTSTKSSILDRIGVVCDVGPVSMRVEDLHVTNPQCARTPLPS